MFVWTGVRLINVHRFRILLELAYFRSLFCFQNAENVGTFSFVSRRPDDQLSLFVSSRSILCSVVAKHVRLHFTIRTLEMRMVLRSIFRY